MKEGYIATHNVLCEEKDNKEGCITTHIIDLSDREKNNHDVGIDGV